MKPPIIGQKVNDVAIDSLIDAIEAIAQADDTFYVGYPVAATVEASITVPALLISHKFGLVCIDVVPTAKATDIVDLKARQRRTILALKAKLLQHPDLADDDGFDLGFKIHVLTYALKCENSDSLQNSGVVDSQQMAEKIKTFSPVPTKYHKSLNAAIERVANIRPKSKRPIAKTANSKGSILKEIEQQIANLDSWQKAAAIETPDGPQRIRGLAGSGKTVVLALKAAYLHGEEPEWKIGVTFHTRALKQQFNTLIRRFYFEDYRQDPDDSHLLVLNSFGGLTENGVYSLICQAYGVPPRDWGFAKRHYGYNGAFQGICAELLREVEKNPKPVFDALLIDEAQDLPSEFLRLAYHCTRDHRIVWAYDDLQNLGDYQMRSLRETFGEDSEGNPVVKLTNEPKKPKQDIILSKCYRNTPWALVTAHALGSGIYREPPNSSTLRKRSQTKLVQHPDNPVLWQEIGYEVLKGDLKLGAPVVLQRSTESSPSFFKHLIDAKEAIQFHQFEDDHDQFLKVSKMICEEIKLGEIYPHDVAVVFPDALSAETRGMSFRRFLADQDLESHLVGVTSSRDAFLLEGMIAISGPHRAKGNEAPVVYLMDADFCASGAELIKRRNILFTAITRSRGWVRVCGIGDEMATLIKEFETLQKKDFKLDFTIPTEEELQKIRTLYRDITSDDRRKAADLKNAFEKLPENLEEANAVLQSLPKELRDRIRRTLSDIEE